MGYKLKNILNKVWYKVMWFLFGSDLGEFIISSLCQFQMDLELFTNKELLKQIYAQDNTNHPDYRDMIPKNDLYCSDCPYRSYSSIAEVIYGDQSSGYCHYLRKGDFDWHKPTLLLWDGCKECGENMWEIEND